MKTLIVPPTIADLSFEHYLNRVVWPLAYWRTSGLDVLATGMELRNKLSNLTVGQEVTLTDKEYEELAKRVGVPEVSAMPPELVSSAWAFAYAILIAKSPNPTV